MDNVRVKLCAFLVAFTAGLQGLHAQDARGQKTGKALIAEDQTELANAKTDLTRAKSNYTAGLAGKRKDFLLSTEYKDAQQAATATTLKANQEHARVMAALEASDAYKDAVEKEKAAQAKVDALRQKKAPAAQISDAATAVMVAGRPVSDMERKALSGDSEYQAANDALVAANKEFSRLKEDFEKNQSKDPAIVALKKTQDDAEIAVQKAQNKLNADQEAQKK